jgi:hypothetical protein
MPVTLKNPAVRVHNPRQQILRCPPPHHFADEFGFVGIRVMLVAKLQPKAFLAALTAPAALSL